jgi:Zn-dependent protease
VKSGPSLLSLLFRCWTIGRLFGVAVRIHWSFWILPLVFLGITWPFGPRVAAFTEAWILTVYTCVVMHEFGHVLAARAFGIKTQDIIMTPLGGIARLKQMAEVPWKEIVIAVAGPMVNVVIASLLFVPVGLIVSADPTVLEHRFPGSWSQLLVFVFFANIGLVVFNMLPAFPSDGGRVFRALLAMFVDRVQATQVAATAGIVVAGLIAIVGLLLGNFVAPFVAGALALFGQMELSMVKYEAAMREGLWVDSRLPSSRQAIVLAPPEPGFSGYAMDPQTNMWIEWRGGVPVRLCRVRGW